MCGGGIVTAYSTFLTKEEDTARKMWNEKLNNVLAEITGAPTKTLPQSYEQYCARMYPNSTYFGQR